MWRLVSIGGVRRGLGRLLYRRDKQDWDRAYFAELIQFLEQPDIVPSARREAAWLGVQRARDRQSLYAEAFFTEKFVLLDRDLGERTAVRQLEHIRLQRSAVGMAEQTKEADLELRLKCNLAALIADASLPDPVGRLTEAIQLYGEVILSASKRRDLAKVAHIKSNRALTVSRLYKIAPGSGIPLEDALADADSALAIRRKLGTQEDVAFSQLHRGVIVLDLAMLTRDHQAGLLAVEAFTEALTLADLIGNNGLLASVLDDLAVAEARTAMLRNDPPDGELWRQAYGHARRTAESSAASAVVRGRANMTMADVLAHTDPESDEVTSRLRQAVDLLTLVDDPVRLREAAGALGDKLAEAGRWAEAGESFERALEADDFLADNGTFSEQPAPVTERSVGPIGRWAAYAFARAGDFVRAVEILDSVKCRHVGRHRRAADADLREIAETAPEMAREFCETRDALRSGPAADRLPQLRFELLSVTRRIRAAGFPEFLRRAPFDAVARGFTPEHPLVYVLTAPIGSVCLIVSEGSEAGVVAVWADGLTSAHLVKATFGDGASLIRAKTSTDYRRLLDEVLPLVGSTLIAPLASELRLSGAKAATLIPSGALTWWPLHAAPLGEGDVGCLWELMPISYLPAAPYRIDDATLRDRREQRRTLVGLADPAGDWPPLPASRLELRSVFEIFPGEAHVVFGKAATGQFLLERLDQPVDLHLGCHASVGEPGQGGAVLKLSDGDLTFADLDRLDGQRPIGLVVAAACSSGMSDLSVAPDEAMNLATGFLNAGATGTITALWPIADRAAALLMRQFAVNAEVLSMDHATALRSAALWLRDLKIDEVLNLAERFEADIAGEPELRRNDSDAATESGRIDRSARTLPYSHPFFWSALIYTGSASRT